ncbi:MAG: helix-turn-helix transcriptional regulator [Gammaproteobacteria bacterium]
MAAKHSTEAGLLQVADGFYSAALERQSWRSALRKVSSYFGGAGSVVFQLDRRTGRIEKWLDHALEHGRDDYAAYAHSINPRIQFSLSWPAPHLCWDARFITDRQMDRHAFYDWLRHASDDLRYFMGSRLLDLGPASVFTSIEFTRKHGHATRQDITAYELLTRHIANAWALRGRAGSDRGLDPIVFATDAIPWGVVVLDSAGRIVEVNREGERILSAGDGLQLAGGGLRTWKVSTNRRLRSLIAAAMATTRQESLSPGGALIVERPSGLPGYGVQIMPCRGSREAMPRAEAAVVLYLSDLASGRGISLSDLRALFGLSQREADLAAHLGRGLSLDAAGDRMRISRNTARNHLQNVFDKTQTNSQAGLIRLMAKFLPR